MRNGNNSFIVVYANVLLLYRFSYVLANPSGSAFWVDPHDGSITLHQTVDYETPPTQVVLIVEVNNN